MTTQLPIPPDTRPGVGPPQPPTTTSRRLRIALTVAVVVAVLGAENGELWQAAVIRIQLLR